MNPFLRIPRIGLIIFFIGFSIGFFLTLLLPDIGTANYVFQLNQADWLKTFYTGKEMDTYFISLMIFIRNLSIALLFAVSPLVLILYILKYRSKHQFKYEHMQKLGHEISRLLSLYSFSVLFIYGFFVYGLFFGFILIQKSVYGLTQLLIYLIPHGILETLGIILAASTGLILKNIWLTNPQLSFKIFWKNLLSKNYLIFIIVLIFIFMISGFIEVNITNIFLEYINKTMN
ncbi:stage II sporulation protein M [[Eubacterium] cellulosolvens]